MRILGAWDVDSGRHRDAGVGSTWLQNAEESCELAKPFSVLEEDWIQTASWGTQGEKNCAKLRGLGELS